jgi:hypothetical protein
MAFATPVGFRDWRRDLLEGQRIRAYIENNPVKAGLAAQAEEYP